MSENQAQAPLEGESERFSMSSSPPPTCVGTGLSAQALEDLRNNDAPSPTNSSAAQQKVTGDKKNGWTTTSANNSQATTQKSMGGCGRKSVTFSEQNTYHEPNASMPSSISHSRSTSVRSSGHTSSGGSGNRERPSVGPGSLFDYLAIMAFTEKLCPMRPVRAPAYNTTGREYIMMLHAMFPSQVLLSRVCWSLKPIPEQLEANLEYFLKLATSTELASSTSSARTTTTSSTTGSTALASSLPAFPPTVVKTVMDLAPVPENNGAHLEIHAWLYAVSKLVPVSPTYNPVAIIKHWQLGPLFASATPQQLPSQNPSHAIWGGVTPPTQEHHYDRISTLKDAVSQYRDDFMASVSRGNIEWKALEAVLQAAAPPAAAKSVPSAAAVAAAPAAVPKSGVANRRVTKA